MISARGPSGIASAPHLCLLTHLGSCFFLLRLSSWLLGTRCARFDVSSELPACSRSSESPPGAEGRLLWLSRWALSAPSNSASGPSASEVRKQVGSSRDCRALCSWPERKSARHLDLTKHHRQRGAGCLPVQLCPQVPAIFTTLSWKHSESSQKRKSSYA